MANGHQFIGCHRVSLCSKSLLILASEKSWNKPGVKTGPVRA